MFVQILVIDEQIVCVVTFALRNISGIIMAMIQFGHYIDIL